MARTTRLVLLALAAGGLMMVSTGCRRPVQMPIHEWHRIVKIPKLETDRARKAREQAERRGREGAQQEGEKKDEAAHMSIWMGRYVWEPYRNRHGIEERRLKAIEILFCPADKADFTQCRIGVAWSRDKDRMGKRLGGD